MVVLVTPSDPFVEWPTGAHGPMHLCWIHMTSGRVLQNAEVVDWVKIYEHLPLMTMDERAGRSSPVWREDLEHTRLDEYWEPLCYQNKLEQIDLPVMHISGWYDDEQVGTPLNFIGMTTRGASEFARKHQKLLVGPWGHQVNTSQKLGEVDFGPEALIDLQGMELAWFDYWLKDQRDEPVVEPPVRIFVMGENKWRDEQEWPLARTRWTSYYLHSTRGANSRFGDGQLSTQEPDDEAPDRYRYDPARPVPFITEPTSSQIGGPDDYAAIERRDDVLVYVTPPLEADLEVTGPVLLKLYAASSARDTDFMAKLVDVHPTGFVQRLCDGMLRARFRNGMQRPELIEPGEVYLYEIDLWNTSQVFLKGHRIGLEIASSAFPKYDRNLNTGEDLGTGTRMQVSEQTIFHDERRPSALILPVIPR
jgi:putative CocE/NonD family hydrolase